MKRSAIITLTVVLILCSLTGCGGYNGKMYEHLSSPASYYEYTAMVRDIYYLYDGDKIRNDYSSERFFDAEFIYISVTFLSLEDLAPFLGVNTENLTVTDPEDQTVTLSINRENSKELYANGFYDAITLDSPVTLTTSRYIYMDGEFFFVIALSFDSTEYLSAQTGLSNVIAMMDANRRLI